jgi:DNA-binding transcriptional ArsR family regulator
MALSATRAILHPVRSRIITLFEAGDRRMTIAELIAALGDVPQATVYRHVRTLVDAKLLAVVETRSTGRVHEAVYAVPDLKKLSMRGDVRARGKRGLLQSFVLFTVTMRAQFARTIALTNVDLERDKIFWVQLPLYLTDAEIDDVRAYIRTLEAKRATGPAANRSLRAITFFDYPLAEGDAVEPSRKHAR